MKSLVVKILLIFIFTGGLFGLFSYMNKWFALHDDNVAEELIERTIEDQLDLPTNSLDLTTDS